MHDTDVGRAVAAGLRFRPLEETIAGAADAPAVEGRRADARARGRAARRRGTGDEGRLPRPRGSTQRRRVRAPLSGRGRRGAAVVLGRGRGRRLRAGRGRCAPDRELDLRARSRRHTTCSSTPAASITAQVILPIRHFLVGVARSHWTRSGSCARTRWRSTSAGSLLASLPEAAAIAAGHDRRRGCPGRARRGPDRGRDRERAGGGAARAGRAGGGRRRPPGGVHPLRRDLEPDRARERRRLADRLLLPDRSPARRAPPRDRAVRAPRARSRPADLAPDPADALALPLRRRRRRPPPRPGRLPRRSPRSAGRPSASRSSAPTRHEGRSRRSSGRSPARRSSSTSRRAAPSSSGASTALKATLDPADGLWIAWPKKAAGLETDLDFDAVQQTGLAARAGRQQELRDRRALAGAAVRLPAGGSASGVGVPRRLPARVVPADQVRIDAARLGEVERQQLEADDVDDRMARRHERRRRSRASRSAADRLGGARGRATLALEHEAAHVLVDRGEVAVQELLEQVRLGGERTTPSRSFSAASCAVGQSRPAPVNTKRSCSETG